ncbi:MAG: N-acetylglucosamine kinase [Chloroflexota bacterium]
MAIFLGVDVGSSKTHALLVDETGRALGFGAGPAGNHQDVGYPGLRLALETAWQQAAGVAGVQAGQLSGAGFGISGYDWPSELPAHLQAVRAAIPLDCPLELANDALLGLLAGSRAGWGINLTAGSSANAIGRGPDGQAARVVGNGWDFGEYAGGCEIARRALQMVSYAWTRRIPPTLLTGALLEAGGASGPAELLEAASDGRFVVGPELARRVFECAAAGDAAALEVLQWAGEELGWLALCIARQLQVEQQAVEVVLSGSIFDGGPLITAPLQRFLAERLPRAELVRLDAPPVAGAALLGLQAAGLDPGPLRLEVNAGARRSAGHFGYCAAP